MIRLVEYDLIISNIEDNRMAKVIVKCVVCGKEMLLFPSIAKQKRTCSKECAAERIPRVTVKCLVCGKKIILPPSLAVTRKTCSRDCDGKLRSKLMLGVSNFIPEIIICPVCGIKFETQAGKQKKKYCSIGCFSKYRREQIEKRHKRKKCPICRKTFIYNLHSKENIYCSHRCQYRAQSLGLIKSYCRGNYGYRPDIGKTLRSSLEANFARVCIYNGWHLLQIFG